MHRTQGSQAPVQSFSNLTILIIYLYELTVFEPVKRVFFYRPKDNIPEHQADICKSASRVCKFQQRLLRILCFPCTVSRGISCLFRMLCNLSSFFLPDTLFIANSPVVPTLKYQPFAPPKSKLYPLSNSQSALFCL